MVALLLLHGFTGAPRSFRRMLSQLDPTQRVGLPVLAGHAGRSLCDAAAVLVEALKGPVQSVAEAPDPLPGPDSFEHELARLARFALHHGLSGGVVAGYSLGGRLALGMLVRYPQLFRGAVLMSTHPGLAEAERSSRLAVDEQRARALLAQPLSEFVQSWESMPLFDTQREVAPELLTEQRRVRCSHRAAGLAASLRCCGLGQMPDFREHLSSLIPGVELVAGERDAKFVELAREMQRNIPDSRLCVEPGAGHNVVLERSEAIARIISQRIGETRV